MDMEVIMGDCVDDGDGDATDADGVLFESLAVAVAVMVAV